jgi:ABC-type nitrate/sulfonate/bicarbonate transport system substrate-binding protein
VYPVFKSNEPDTIRGWGFDLNMWEAADFGVPTLGLAYVATDETVAADPEMLGGFMRAAIRGIEYARDHPAQAVEIVMGYVGEGGDSEHQRFILDTELVDAENDLTSVHGYGWQTAEQWTALHDFLVSYEAIAGPVEIADVFTTEFLAQR